MAFKMGLWLVDGDKLKEIQAGVLDTEARLEEWICREPTLLGMDVLIVGQQVLTENRGRIDLLGIDSDGELVIIELKRDKTPRDIIGQILDYASWARTLDYSQVDAIANKFLKKGIAEAFSEHFGEALPEDEVNGNHRMVIVASELDDSSQRIVEYLAEEHNVNINVIFFSFFKVDDEELLGRAWLLDPEEVEERSVSRKAPWSGYWFVNVGEGMHRNWEDNVRYGFTSAGQGKAYSQSLKKLHVGDKIFAYIKGTGYVGFGEITQEASMIKNFTSNNENKSLLSLPLKASKAGENSDNPEKSEWVVGVKWHKTFPRSEAKTFKGVFANQNIVCKLRHPPTVEFVKKQFEVTD